MCVRTRTCVRWWLSLQEQRCGGQRPGDAAGEVWRGLREDVARDAGREEEVVERCTCVVVSLYTCISARYCLCLRARRGEYVLVFLPYFGNMSGKGREWCVTREKRRYKRRCVDMDVRLQMPRLGISSSVKTSHPFKCHCVELTVYGSRYIYHLMWHVGDMFRCYIYYANISPGF